MVGRKKLYRKDHLIGVRVEPYIYEFLSDYSLRCGRKIPEILRALIRKFVTFAKDKDLNIELICNEFLLSLSNRNVNNCEPAPYKF